MPNIHNGDSMRRPSLSSTCTGRTTLWKSMEMEDIHTSDLLPQRTQDGGNYSELKVLTSEMREVNILTFKVKLILKEDTSNVTKLKMVRSINSGTSSMLMNGRVNPPRVNSMKNMDSTSKDHSMSSQLCLLVNILRSLTIETWSSRPETTKRDKSGGSTKDH
jgi:hypothetical protein